MTWVHGKRGDDIRFDPPLILERQRWILETLRKEKVTSVLDIGCGEGNLLQALSFPALTISEPCIKDDLDLSEEDESEFPSLHLKRLAGLDISEEALNRASERISPLTDRSSGSPTFKRWTDLETKLYLGDLTVFDKEIDGYEAIVSSEVIEHLPEQALSAFGPVLLGEYRPRLLLITTPNFSFNVRFNREGESERGYLDPTGRTNRIFRHDDHKFEWTPEEFSSWATSLANEYGYISEQSAIGIPTSSLPPPSASATYAVHCCVFRLDPKSHRHQGLLSSRSRAHLDTDVGKYRLWRSIISRATCRIEQEIDFETIREIVRDLMLHWDRKAVSISELWPELGSSCGGSKRVLVQALGGWGNVPPPPPSPLSTATFSRPCSYELFDPLEFFIQRVEHDLEIRWNYWPAYETSSPGPMPSDPTGFDSRKSGQETEERKKERRTEESIPGWE